MLARVLIQQTADSPIACRAFFSAVFFSVILLPAIITSVYSEIPSNQHLTYFAPVVV